MQHAALCRPFPHLIVLHGASVAAAGALGASLMCQVLCARPIHACAGLAGLQECCAGAKDGMSNSKL